MSRKQICPPTFFFSPPILHCFCPGAEKAPDGAQLTKPAKVPSLPRRGTGRACVYASGVFPPVLLFPPGHVLFSRGVVGSSAPLALLDPLSFERVEGRRTVVHGNNYHNKEVKSRWGMLAFCPGNERDVPAHKGPVRSQCYLRNAGACG